MKENTSVQTLNEEYKLTCGHTVRLNDIEQQISKLAE